MIQSTRRSSRVVLLALAMELAAAAMWRWPWTALPIQTPFDYGTGHVAVVSENWRQQGATRRHFLPVMSIDAEIPEWPYRTELSQEYTSVPPLAFILHYAVTRALPRAEPVLLGKLLAQGLIAASILGSAVFLADAFGAIAAFVGLTFALWAVPFLLWFSNGYFAVNVGLAAQLVLAGWCAAIARRCLVSDHVTGAKPAAHAMLGAALAFAGAFADYMPLIGNAIAVAGLAAVAAARGRGTPAARQLAVASAAGVAAGSTAAGLLTLALYGTRLGLRRYLAAVTLRTAQRSGHAPLAVHLDVIRRQMLTAWPPAVLVALGVMLAAVCVWAAIVLLRRDASAADGAVALLTLGIAAGPSLFFHYTAVSYVGIHWWFAGTWTLTWSITCCAFASMARRTRIAQYAAVMIVAVLVILDVRFTNAQSAIEPERTDFVQYYRALGADLPHDSVPLVVTDVTIDRRSFFEDFPYVTGYLLRPVLLRDADGTIRLPSAIEPYDGKMVRFGGEAAGHRLDARGGDVYVAYDPSARRCAGADVPLGAWHRELPIAICRVRASALVASPDTVLTPITGSYPCHAAPPQPSGVHVVRNRGGVVVLSWSSSYSRASYLLEAGRSAGQSDALSIDAGPAKMYTATEVQPGTYYVRVRGRNSCGTGAASSDVRVVVE